MATNKISENKGGASSNLPPKGKGRPKGAKNKTTKALHEAILAAAENVGYDGMGSYGLEGYLQNVAEKDMRSFCTLLGKVLPKVHAGDPENPIKVIGSISIVGVDPSA